MLAGVRAYLGPDYDVDTHFTPKYRPWRQRIAFVPDGDIFKGIAAGKATVVTDEIENFTEKGILLQSGKELEADIIVTATGFNLSVLGDIKFEIDGKPLDFAKTVTYRGMMFTGVPNMVWIFGYFRASWTLRVDLLGDFVCRLLNHMKEKGAKKVEVALRPEDKDMELKPWIDPENFNPGYLMRSMHLLPKRGEKPEWQHTQDYWVERERAPGHRSGRQGVRLPLGYSPSPMGMPGGTSGVRSFSPSTRVISPSCVRRCTSQARCARSAGAASGRSFQAPRQRCELRLEQRGDIWRVSPCRGPCAPCRAPAASARGAGWRRGGRAPSLPGTPC